MTANRIEQLGNAPYATNDRAFYIYFDEATDGYRVKDNWCPEPLFDANRPGPANVWINNGPTVSDSIKSAAGLQPEYNYLKDSILKQTNYHLFDFLDFDTELKTDESLWKACKTYFYL